MFYTDIAVGAAEDALEMHQTAHIGGRDELRAMFDMVGAPVLSHFYRDCFFRHAESSAKSTTFIDTIESYELEPPDHAQQPLQLREGRRHQFAHLCKMQTALPMTALMKTHLMGKCCFEVFDLQYACEKFDKLENLFRDPGITMEVFLDMQYAAAGRGDDIVEVFEIFDEEFITASCEVFESRIGHGLSATGLIGRVNHFATQLL